MATPEEKRPEGLPLSTRTTQNNPHLHCPFGTGARVGTLPRNLPDRFLGRGVENMEIVHIERHRGLFTDA